MHHVLVVGPATAGRSLLWSKNDEDNYHDDDEDDDDDNYDEI